MRALVALYFVIGIVLLALGFLATGACTERNTDVLDDVVFVLTWPVSLYANVIHGPLSTEGWLHAQACGGGLHGHTTVTVPN